MKKLIGLSLAGAILSGTTLMVLADSDDGDCDERGGWGKGKYGEYRGSDDRREYSRHDPQQMQQRMLDRLDRRLELSDQQRQQVSELMADHWADKSGSRPERQALREAFSQLDPSAPDYTAQVEALAKQKADAMAQNMVKRAQHHAELFAILTPEQQQNYRELMQQRGEHQRHHGRW